MGLSMRKEEREPQSKGRPMHLVELLAMRSIAGAGLSLGITRRCPLHCAHCSTDSTLSSEQGPAEMFLRFVDTFTPENHPQVIVMSGGEAMLRPHLVRDLALRSREVGTYSAALSGLFFAPSGRIPTPIRQAIRALDHFSVSIDKFHEQEVPRTDVYRILDTLLNDGTNLSVHLAGTGATDPYLENITDEIMTRFERRIPMIVNRFSHFGRARSWLPIDKEAAFVSDDPAPCGMASWPLVAFDGTIVACANDDVIVDPPDHLRLGHASIDDWPTIRSRSIQSCTVRAIRLYGPGYVAAHFGHGNSHCAGYCQTCMNLPNDRPTRERIDRHMSKPSVQELEHQVETLHGEFGGVSFARRQTLPRYAELVTLGMGQ